MMKNMALHFVVMFATLLLSHAARAQSILLICDATFSGSGVDQTSGTYGFTFDLKNKLLSDSHGNRYSEVEIAETESYGKRRIVAPTTETRGLIMHARINRMTSRFEVGLSHADGKDLTGSAFYNPNYMFGGKPQQSFQIAFGTCRIDKKLF